MRVAVLATGYRTAVRKGAVVLLVLVAAACGGQAKSMSGRHVAHVLAARAKRCADRSLQPLGTKRVAYAGVAAHGAVAYRRPGGAAIERFGAKNVNDYPTVFGVVGAVVNRQCKAMWYRVELPIRPNGATGFVRAWTLDLEPVTARVVIDVSRRQLALYQRGRLAWTATVAVGSPATPTPIGRFYVNQRLIPDDASGPFGPAAIGISAFSNVLTGWVQGGPVAIHGTNEPWSIGHAVSNGCIRLPNSTLRRLFKVAVAGTPVIIHP
jgi:lipoprotein-anchoring transpeptidase ErfK/SrfK